MEGMTKKQGNRIIELLEGILGNQVLMIGRTSPKPVPGNPYMSPEQLEALTGSRTGLAVADPPEGLPPLKSAPAVLGMLPVAPLTLPAAPAPDQGVPTSNVAEESPPQSPSKKKSTVRIGVPQDPYAKQTVKDLDPHRLIFMPESEWHSDAKQTIKINMPAGDAVPAPLPQQLKDLPEHQREKAAKKMVKDLEAFGYEVKKPKD